jgi:hypothetical protein
MSPWTWIVIGGVVLVGLLLLMRRQRPPRHHHDRPKEDLDTVAGWPPEATRVLSTPDRMAHQALVNALPEYLVLAQVPLARFIKVPRRHSHTEWITRVGHLCADLLVCDKSTQAIAVVILQSPGDSERGQRRNKRMRRVLAAAKLRVMTWDEGPIPDRDVIRETLLPPPPPSLSGPAPTSRPAPAVAATATATATAARSAASSKPAAPRPAPHADGLDTDPQRDPPRSTWFDDLESGPSPLDGGTPKAPPPAG